MSIKHITHLMAQERYGKTATMIAHCMNKGKEFQVIAEGMVWTCTPQPLPQVVFGAPAYRPSPPNPYLNDSLNPAEFLNRIQASQEQRLRESLDRIIEGCRAEDVFFRRIDSTIDLAPVNRQDRKIQGESK